MTTTAEKPAPPLPLKHTAVQYESVAIPLSLAVQALKGGRPTDAESHFRVALMAFLHLEPSMATEGLGRQIREAMSSTDAAQNVKDRVGALVNRAKREEKVLATLREAEALKTLYRL